MIGTQPVYALAPLEYRYALDGAAALLAHQHPLVVCSTAELQAEVDSRWKAHDAAQLSGTLEAALWVEPQRENWQTELEQIRKVLAPAARLLILISSPAARLLPERRHWQDAPLGLQHNGSGLLRRALPRAGLTITAEHALHTSAAVFTNWLATLNERLGQPFHADRLNFAARLRYTTQRRTLLPVTLRLLVCRSHGRVEA